MPGKNSDSGARRNQLTRFSFSILVSPKDLADPAAPARCAVPVRGQKPLPDVAPEVGLNAALSQASTLGPTTTTDKAGKGVLQDASPGFNRFDIEPADRLFRIQFAVDLQTSKTAVYGTIRIDPDGEPGSWQAVVEVLPDANDDLISDTGRRERWTFTPNGGTGYRHLENGRSEMVALDEDGLEWVKYEAADLDGDFVPDQSDPDKDGDGKPNDKDIDLPCPGFSHDQLFASASLHKNMQCTQCHLVGNPKPLYCDDCHSSLGRAWMGAPADAPAGHFQRGCEQCHAADKGWAAGLKGQNHSVYPLTGAHLGVDCFSCHLTGDVSGLPQACEGCHAADAPPNHSTGSCSNCHTTDNWVPK